MIEKINFSKIIRSHLDSLKDNQTYSCTMDYLLFFGLPLALSILLNYQELPLDISLINILITASSIFAGLLLNLLMLIYTIIIRIQDEVKTRKIREPDTEDPVQEVKDDLKIKVLKETFTNVSFCILISVLLVILCLIQLVNNHWLSSLIPYVVYFLVPLMILTILMVLKRVHSLIASEFI